MARYSIEDTTLTNIANAIRTKTGSAEAIQVSDMADEIKGISGGGVTSWNDLTDKPFGEETPEPIVFDGNLDGKVIMEYPLISTIKEQYGEDAVWVYVKVSDVPFTKEQLGQAKFSLYSVINGEVEHHHDLSAEFDFLEFDSKTVTGDNNLMVLSFSEAGDYPIAPDDGIVFQPPEKGLYFVYQNIPKMQLISYISGVTFSSQIKTLDEKFLPDTIARKTDIPEGGVTSWNDLTDKPFDETMSMGDTLVFDWEEDPTNKDIFRGMYKVYGTGLTVQDLERGGTITYYYKGKMVTSPFGLYSETGMTCGYVIKDTDMDTTFGCIVTNYNPYYGTVPPSLGLYFAYGQTINYFPLTTVSLTVNGFSQFETPIIKQIDKKFIPLTEYATYEYVDYSYTIAGKKDGTILGKRATAEGCDNTASGSTSHAEGSYNTASGHYSHAEGSNNTASGDNSHVEGRNNTASGNISHAEGQYTIASGIYQHVQGRGNLEDTENKYAHIVGNGSPYDPSKRSNAHTLDWSGNAWFAGDIKVGGIGQDDETAKTLATTDYVANQGVTILTEARAYIDSLASNYTTVEQVTSLINNALGVIENGTY